MGPTPLGSPETKRPRYSFHAKADPSPFDRVGSCFWFPTASGEEADPGEGGSFPAMFAPCLGGAELICPSQGGSQPLLGTLPGPCSTKAL